MNEDTLTKLSITTSVAKAIELYPLIHESNYREENRFLSLFKISFHEPKQNQAVLTRSVSVPDKTWFSIFDDAEKEIMEDEYAFYGIQYSTKAKLALNRVKKLIEKLEEEMSSRSVRKAVGRHNFYHRDQLKQIEHALTKFHEGDQVCLSFVFSEWPNIEVSRRKDFVKEFESNLLGNNFPPDDIPF